MPSYSIFSFRAFPEKTTIVAEEQRFVLDYTTQTTEIKYLHDVNNFEKSEVSHYQEVSFTGTPYSHGERIDEVTELHKFDAYIHQCLKIMLMKHKKKICDVAVKRLNIAKPELQIKRQKLDLKTLIPEFRTLHGTYFRDIQIPNVNSSAIFGTDVDKSSLFQTLEKLGSISAIRTKIDLKGVEHKVIISKDYTITILSKYSESEELKIVLSLKSILDKAILATPADLANSHNDAGDLEHDTGN